VFGESNARSQGESNRSTNNVAPSFVVPFRQYSQANCHKPKSLSKFRVSDTRSPSQTLESRRMNCNVDESCTSTASSRRLRCILLMADAPPGAQLGNVRIPPKGLLRWLLHIEERFGSKIHPQLRTASHVRGVSVAIDYLLQAFLQESQCATLTFVVPNHRQEEFERWATVYRAREGETLLEICTTTELLGRGACPSAPDIWLDLRGVGHLAFRLRNHFSSRILPAVILQHGLSEHILLYQLYLRTLLTPHYPCDSLVCTSTACQKALAKILDSLASSFNRQYGTDLKFSGRLDVIPLCVDTEQFRPSDKHALRKQLGIPKGALLLLYVGYLSQTKADLTPLLPIVRKLIGANPCVDLRLVVAGTGPEEYSKELLSVIQELGLADRVIVMRKVSDVQKEKLFGAADIFVGPCQSMQESFGLTPIEAMACGLPQVVADWNGYRDTVVHGETGFLIPTIWGRCDGDLYFTGDLLGWPFDHITQGQSIVMDLDSMHEHLQILINQPELRAAMSKRSRARAVAQFSYASVARLYDELWVELTAIAATVQPAPDLRHFDQTAYFDYFGHFATWELCDDAPIRVGGNNVIPIETLVRVCNAELPGIATLNQPLLVALSEILATAASSSETISVGQLISAASSKAWSTDAVRRHILFLLKHGRVTIASYNRPN
jgi:D-inositol-3-phosphate glycosyltransferase